MASTLGRKALGLAAVAAIAGAAVPATAAAKSDPRGNSLGIQVVKFAHGTSPAAMRQAVKDAGGEIVTDLSKLDRVTVVPKAAGFGRQIRAVSSVKGVWLDHVSKPQALFTPDPFHDADGPFWGEDAPGQWQWEDDRDGVEQAWNVTKGAGIKVAVIDTGIDPNHAELAANTLFVDNTIPCNRLTAIFGGGIGGLHDCSEADTEGHGTWVASRIVGDDNGFASNGIAPDAKVMGYKALATGFGGLTSWIVDAMVRACDNDADVINMSLGGYDDLNDPDFPTENADDYLFWKAGVDYCRKAGTAIVASAGNEHVRNLRRTVTVKGSGGSVSIAGAGVVSTQDNECVNALPGEERERYANDFCGMLETPAGVPGVIMVSSTSNAIPAPTADVLPKYAPPASAVGTRDNLAYYSSYGERVDITAPGGGRKFGIPRFDAAPGTDVLYGGWGQLGATTKTGELCRDTGDAGTFACFTVDGESFGWLQGTSMSSPQVAGVAALALAANPALQEKPDALAAKLKGTAAKALVNHTGKTLKDGGAAWDGTACAAQYCHVSFATTGQNAIPFAQAYGAGMVNAAAAVAP
jgi:subtilisin family serine protease